MLHLFSVQHEGEGGLQVHAGLHYEVRLVGGAKVLCFRLEVTLLHLCVCSLLRCTLRCTGKEFIMFVGLFGTFGLSMEKLL